MRLLTSALLLATTIGCGESSEPEPYYLEKDFYAWDCADYEDYTEVYVSTETCDSSVQFIVAELHLDDGFIWKTRLKTDYEGSCLWDETFVLIDEYCIQVEGVTLTAWAQ